MIPVGLKIAMPSILNDNLKVYFPIEQHILDTNAGKQLYKAATDV